MSPWPKDHLRPAPKLQAADWEEFNWKEWHSKDRQHLTSREEFERMRKAEREGKNPAGGTKNDRPSSGDEISSSKELMKRVTFQPEPRISGTSPTRPGALRQPPQVDRRPYSSEHTKARR